MEIGKLRTGGTGEFSHTIIISVMETPFYLTCTFQSAFFLRALVVVVVVVSEFVILPYTVDEAVCKVVLIQLYIF